MMTAGRRSAVIPTQWSMQNLCLNAGLKAKRVPANETRPESKDKIKNPLQTWKNSTAFNHFKKRVLHKLFSQLNFNQKEMSL